MFFMQSGDILPGIGIGNIKLGMNLNDVEKIIPNSSIQHLPEFYILHGGDIKVWINISTNCVTQIMVFGTFKGKLMNEFGIGSHLSAIEQKLNQVAQEEHYVYIIKNLKGICFELEEIEEDWDNIDWFKSNSKINFISVFKDNNNINEVQRKVVET